MGFHEGVRVEMSILNMVRQCMTIKIVVRLREVAEWMRDEVMGGSFGSWRWAADMKNKNEGYP